MLVTAECRLSAAPLNSAQAEEEEADGQRGLKLPSIAPQSFFLRLQASSLYPTSSLAHQAESGRWGEGLGLPLRLGWVT